VTFALQPLAWNCCLTLPDSHRTRRTGRPAAARCDVDLLPRPAVASGPLGWLVKRLVVALLALALLAAPLRRHDAADRLERGSAGTGRDRAAAAEREADLTIN
jgi:hypothetical protein